VLSPQIEFSGDFFSGWVSVTEQHPCIPVSAEKGHLWDRQASFEKPAYGLVAKVVEVEIRYLRSLSDSIPRQPKSICCEWKNPLIKCGRSADDVRGCIGEGDYAGVAVLCVWNQQRRRLSINVLSSQRQNFTTPQAGFDC
jgi:hypothetical protein